MKELEDLEKLEFPYINPTEETERFWIYGRRKEDDYFVDKEKSGKWLVFVEQEKVNELWSLIKKETENGCLGQASKVSTAKPKDGGQDDYVICVYTGNYSILPDVMRVRQSLRKIGVKKEIVYKTDQATRNGERNYLYKL